MEKKGILARVSEDDIKRVFKDYDERNHISIPPCSYFNELEINEYNDCSGYWIDIDMFYNNDVSMI